MHIKHRKLRLHLIWMFILCYHFLKIIFIFKFVRFWKYIEKKNTLIYHHVFTSSKKIKNDDLLFSALGMFLKKISEKKIFSKFQANIFSLLLYIFFKNKIKTLKIKYYLSFSIYSFQKIKNLSPINAPWIKTAQNNKDQFKLHRAVHP